MTTDTEVLLARAQALARPVATPPADTMELVTFQLANETYGIESRYVIEMCRLAQLAILPGARPPVFGLTAWRGEILSVLDIRPVLGVATAALNDLSRVIVLGEERAALGVLVDAVHEIVRLPATDVGEPPAGVAAARDYLRGVTGEALLVLAGERLLSLSV